MNKLNVFLLSAVPLPADLHNETGAYFASEMMIGPDLLMAKVYREIRSAVGSAVFINLNVMYPASAMVTRSRLDYYRTCCVDGDEEANFALHMLEVDDSQPSFLQTFVAIERYLSDVSGEFRGNAPVLIMAGDTVISGQSPFFSAKSLHCKFRFLAIPARDPHLDLPYREMLAQSSRWTAITPGIKQGSYIVEDRTPEHGVPPSAGLLYAGVCSFANASLLKKFLQSARKNKNSLSDTEFFQALFSFPSVVFDSKELPALEMCHSGFYDFGHVDTYWFSKFQNLAPRHFNGLRVDFEAGTITKTSSSALFKDQAAWMLHASRSPSLQHYVPPSTVELNPKTGAKELTMSLVGYPSLSDMLLQNVSEYHWSTAASRVAKVFCLLATSTPSSEGLPATNKDDFQEACQSMYYEKTVKRLSEFFDQRPDLHTVLLDVDGKRGEVTKKSLLLSLSIYAKESKLLNKPSYSASLVHGDLCFSNILFDRKTTSVKIIDPRGNFGNLGRYADPAYDLAKLMHSYNGFYDLILARVVTVEKSIGMRTTFPPFGYFRRLEIFQKTFMAYVNKLVLARRLSMHIVTRAKLIEPLLFLSMLPLHSDNPGRQKTLYVRGLELLHSNLSQWGKKCLLGEK